jgi:hypothetical protein
MEFTEARGVPRAGVFVGMHPSKGSEISLQTVAKREILK